MSYIEAIAAKRNRNVEWARSAVRESASIPVDKALELKVIEIIAKDLADLQQQLDGRVVERCGGEGPPGTPSDGPSRIGREASATSSSFTSSKVSIPMRSQWSPPSL